MTVSVGNDEEWRVKGFHGLSHVLAFLHSLVRALLNQLFSPLLMVNVFHKRKRVVFLGYHSAPMDKMLRQKLGFTGNLL